MADQLSLEPQQSMMPGAGAGVAAVATLPASVSGIMTEPLAPILGLQELFATPPATADVMTRLQAVEDRLAAALLRLESVGTADVALHGIQFYGTGDASDGSRHLGVIAFTLDQQPHGLVAAALAAEYRIGVRNGCFCAHPYLVRFLVLSQNEIGKVRAAMASGDRSVVPGMVRISFGMYNSLDDIDRLAVALERIFAGRLGATYRQDRDSGEFVAEGSPMDPADAFLISR